METKKIILGSILGCLAFIGIILTIVLLAVSVRTLKNEEMALKYHTISRHLDRHQKPYVQGRHFLQPGEKFFKFPRVYKLEEMENSNSVHCVSRDGLALDLDITYQFRLRQEVLITLFSLFGMDYEPVIRYQTMEAIRSSCGNWTSTEFYYRRQEVQTDMGIRVDKRLDEVFCDGGFLQLVNVRFDKAFSLAVEAVQAETQDIAQAEIERGQRLIQAKTEVLKAQQYANITLTNARADATSLLARADADARTITANIDSQRIAYGAIKNTFGFTGQDLINYISTQAIQSVKTPVIAVNSPAKFAFDHSSL